MNGISRPLFRFASELRTLVEKSCNETLSGQECDRLNELLRGDAEAQSFYLTYLSIHAGLSWEFGPRPSVEAIGDVGIPLEESYAATETGKPAASAARRPSKRRRRSWAVAGAAVAAAAVLLAGVFLVDWTPEIAHRPGPPAIDREPGAATIPAEDPAAVAAVPKRPAPPAVLSGCVHKPGAEPEPLLKVGKPLPDGRLALAAGIGEVTFADGVIVLLEGPGELEVLDASRGFLHLGQAVVRVPKGTEGFTLETESVNVHDFGTEFAVRVEPSGETEIQVLDGAVIARVKDADNKAVVERPMKAGQAVAVAAATDAGLEPAVHEIAFAPERFVRRLPKPEHVAVVEERAPDPAEAADAGLLEDAVLVLSFDRDTITKDGDAITFKDLSGNGNDAKTVGATWTEEGISGGACKLDGVDDYVACQDSPSLNIKGPLTISMWVNLTAWDNEGGLCTKGLGDGGESWLIDMRGKRVRFVRRPTSVKPYKEVLANESVTPGKWYHVVAVADGQRLRLYTNMNQSITEDYTEASLLNDHILTIGSRQAHDGPYDASIAGIVDEVAIWPRALRPDEVEMLYNRGKEGKPLGNP